MHRGYIKLWRAIWDNPHWLERPFEPARAWLDLLLLANFKDSSFRKRGNRIDVKRGQVGRSIKGLSDRWGWSPGKVDRYLHELARGDEPQIEYQKSHLTTIITIINYKRYQGDGEQNGEQTDNRRITDGEQTNTYKNEKNIKKEKKESIVAGDKITFDRSTRKFDGITPDYLYYLKGQYPAVDVDGKLREMETWLDANPKNQKSNYKRFITNWLKREQDKAPRADKQEPGTSSVWDKYKENK